ncbi:MAG: zinc-dependent metalloprotease [Cyclobacteriaceae bacterium]|nr:zinc-dependent metalloprotease [Cyclobacteriaceae bacterium]
MCVYLCVNGQNPFQECGTLPLDSAAIVNQPWYGNNAFLKEYRDKKEKIKKDKKKKGTSTTDSSSRTESVCVPNDYLVPIRMIVWQNSQHNENMTSAIAESYVAEANIRFQQAGSSIQFYLARSPLFRTNTAYSDGLTGGEQLDMFTSEYNSKQITVHLIGGDEGGGVAVKLLKSCWVRTDGWNATRSTREFIGGILAHELGHVLGLQHTHDAARLSTSEDNGSIFNGCYQESVSRVKRNYWYNGCAATDNQLKCEINGDQLCDTPADPNMNKLNYDPEPTSPTGCTYTLPSSGDYRTDNWGALWQPHARNIMAYNNQKCRNFFSPGQITIMHYTLDTDWSGVTPQLTVANSPVCYNQTTTVAMPQYYGDYESIYGASYQWDNGSGLYVSSGQGTTTATVKGNSSTFSGYTDVHVHVTSPTGDFCLTTPVWVGVPPKPTYITGFTSPCIGNLEYYDCSPSTTATSYQWSLDPLGSGWSIQSQIGTSASVRIGESQSYIRVKASNSCGVSGLKYILVTGDDCSGGGGIQLVFSPNPTNSESIGIQVIEPNTSASTIGKETTYNLNIFDENGVNVYKENSTNRNFRINKSLKTGVYIVNVNNGQSVVTERLVIE